MADTPITLYRYAPGWEPDPDEAKPLSRTTFKVGEFRQKVAWCKTHESNTPGNVSICCIKLWSVRHTLKAGDCELVEIWMEAV